MTPDQAATFSEDDEDPAKIIARLSRGPHGWTAPARPAGPVCELWWPSDDDPGVYDCGHHSCWAIAEGTPVSSVSNETGGYVAWTYPSGRLRITAPWDLP